MLDHALAPAHYIEREIGMFQSIHVELHRVATSIGLKDARQRRRSGVGKVPVYQKAVQMSFLQTQPRPDGAQVLIRRSGPIPFAQRFTQAPGLLFCWDASYSMSGTPFWRASRIPETTAPSLRRPGLQLHLTRWGCPNRG